VKLLVHNISAGSSANKYWSLFYSFYGILTLFLGYSDQSEKRVRNPPLMWGIWNQLFNLHSTPNIHYKLYSTPNLLLLQIIWERRSYYWHPGLLILIRSHRGSLLPKPTYGRYSINSLCFEITLEFTNYLPQWFQALVHFQGGSNTLNSSIAEISIVVKSVEENTPVSVQEVKLYM